MKRIFMITAIILALSTSYSYAHMHESGMTGHGMMGETSQGQTTSPGYGGHMTSSGMMGSGGHMMGSGSHMGCGEHMIGGIMGFDTEEENRKFLDDTTDLRREMHNKKFEYSEALRNPDTKGKTLLKLKKEMLEIKIKMYEKAIKNN